jgi:hypothetical protein
MMINLINNNIDLLKEKKPLIAINPLINFLSYICYYSFYL